MHELAHEDWHDLVAGNVDAVCVSGRDHDGLIITTGAIFPGAFDPLHDGHRSMAKTAADILGTDVEFELSIANVDKPALCEADVARRLARFDSPQAIWITRAATFVEKAQVFPKSTFIVGADTMVRVADRRYYGDDEVRSREVVAALASQQCRFLVFGRSGPSGFQVLSDLDLPPRLRELCQEVPAVRFRADVSSTGLRRGVSR